MASDAGADATSDDAQADVALVEASDLPDANQDPDVYPGSHSPIPTLDFLGGPIIATPKIVTVTFNYDPRSDGDGGTTDTDPFAPRLAYFDDFITTSQWWTSVMSGFNVGMGSSGGHYAMTDTVSNMALADSDVQAYIQAQITAGTLPPADDQTIYAMYFPPTTTISLEGGVSCNDFLGYHESVTVSNPGGGNVKVAYAVLPHCTFGGAASDDFDQLTITASHEFAEAASDPQPTENPAYYLVTNDAWIPSVGLSFAGGECGDLCLYAPSYDESGFAVQAIWSNSAAMASQNPCEPSTGTFYEAAVRTTEQTIEGHKSSGYIPIVRGKTVSTIIDFFSDAALPHDVDLYVGVAPVTYGPVTDPTALAPVGGGITVTLSQTTANNGDGLFMTTTVPATIAAGDYPLIVRSVLESDDYHDWPVIIHVTTK